MTKKGTGAQRHRGTEAGRSRHFLEGQVKSLEFQLDLTRREIESLKARHMDLSERYVRISDEGWELRRSLRPWWERLWNHFVPQP